MICDRGSLLAVYDNMWRPEQLSIRNVENDALITKVRRPLGRVILTRFFPALPSRILCET